MAGQSAGLLLYRRADDGTVEVLLGHMGGPFWARKDEGAWTLPKGEYDPATEDAHDAAVREFTEELGTPPPAAPDGRDGRHGHDGRHEDAGHDEHEEHDEHDEHGRLDRPDDPDGPDLPLGTVRQRAGKTVTAWARRGDLDVTTVVPGTFEMEWPPRSGRRATFPELDRVAWLGLPEARRLVVAGQVELLDRLERSLDGGTPTGSRTGSPTTGPTDTT